MAYNPEFLDIKTTREASDEILKIGASGIAFLTPKAIFKVIKFHGVRNSMANIIKQECLSIGMEAAVNKGCVNCTIEKSDVILMGTLKHYKKLVEKLEKQVSEMPEIAKELKEIVGQIK